MEHMRNKGIYQGVFLALFIALGVQQLSAQVDKEKVTKFIGIWGRDGSQDRGNCAGYLGDGGESLNNCAIPADRLPLNERGKAWFKFYDELASPVLNDCFPMSFPSLWGVGYAWEMSAKVDGIRQYFGGGDGTTNNVTRKIWMDGRPHPPAGEVFQFGHAIGHFDGDDLIVESSNYTFDPDGMDDHLHMASSVLKKITERYHLIDDSTMRITITLEDPLFLTKPFVYAHIHKRLPGQQVNTWLDCDPEVSRGNAEASYPAKYK
jgi:hypothetical protein